MTTFDTRRLMLLLAPAILTICGTSAIAEVVHVNAGAQPQGADGATWESAYPDLQDALAQASPGDEIWIASGTYKPDRGTRNTNLSFDIPSGVSVYGGFQGTESTVDQRDPDHPPTILSGNLGQPALPQATGPLAAFVVSPTAGPGSEWDVAISIRNLTNNDLGITGIVFEFGFNPDELALSEFQWIEQFNNINQWFAQDDLPNPAAVAFADAFALFIPANGELVVATMRVQVTPDPNTHSTKLQLCDIDCLFGIGVNPVAADPESKSVEFFTENSVFQCSVDPPVLACPPSAIRSRHVVSIMEPTQTVLLDGLTISGGDTGFESLNAPPGSGGGLYIVGSEPRSFPSNQTDVIVRECKVVGNHGGQGAGIYAENMVLHILDSEVTENCTYVSGEGGGIMAINTKLNISDCSVSRNKTGAGFADDYTTPMCHGGNGGGMYLEESDAIVNRSVFHGNQTGDGGAAFFCYENSCGGGIGGAIRARNTSLSVHNSLIRENWTGDGGVQPCGDDDVGGPGGPGSAPAISHNANIADTLVRVSSSTVVANRMGCIGGAFFPTRGPAIHKSSNKALTLVVDNTIMWNPDITEFSSGGFANIRYCCVRGGEEGQSIIDADPMFVDFPFDPRLTQGSPCIDTGDPSANVLATEVDLARNPRVLCDQIDIGAYESVDGFADHDGNNVIDLFDFREFPVCENGPDNTPASETCTPLDTDCDGDVDLRDFGMFQRLFNPTDE